MGEDRGAPAPKQHRMRQRSNSQAVPEDERIYCIVPRRFERRLRRPLERRIAPDPAVELIWDRRRSERRDWDRRRPDFALEGPPDGDERRRITAAAGRRVSERRAVLAPVEAPWPLPRKARRRLDRPIFFRRVPEPPDAERRAEAARLVLRYQAGDREAFEELFRRHLGHAYCLLTILLGDRAAARSGARAAFREAAREALDTDPLQTPWLPLLLRAARRQASASSPDAGPAASAEPRLSDGPALGAWGAPLKVFDPESLDRLSDGDLLVLVGRLSPSERCALASLSLLGLSPREAAVVMGVDPESVVEAERSGLRALRSLLRSPLRTLPGPNSRGAGGRAETGEFLRPLRPRDGDGVIVARGASAQVIRPPTGLAAMVAVLRRLLGPRPPRGPAAGPQAGAAGTPGPGSTAWRGRIASPARLASPRPTPTTGRLAAPPRTVSTRGHRAPRSTPGTEPITLRRSPLS